MEEAIARWRRDPEYVKEYDALEEEFALVSEIIKARAAAGLTQAELAKRMKTTQGAIARLESGSSMPSTRTLKRFAAATGHKLKIRSNLRMPEYRLVLFEPEARSEVVDPTGSSFDARFLALGVDDLLARDRALDKRGKFLLGLADRDRGRLGNILLQRP